ncbi:transporter substrate-binding domain-containing protein [Ihubacter sp. rT4E-8]|uniref:transporter substrate-binding domain-containing protein n=1 Tax=unclassified Ihubacter TaxID=2633299 RepID=UPI00137AC504
MKNFKKVFALVMALVMIFTLASCGGEKKDAGTESDKAYVQDKGKLVVGITEFAPMDYKDDNGEWIGFDADMAKAFAESLGVDVEFIVIDWDNKIMELEGKSIDVVWNGMTLVDEVKAAMGTSVPYCKNAQVVVVPKEKAADYQTEDAIKKLSFAAEAGSAGEKLLKGMDCEVVSVQTQADALMEVAAGTSEACVIDLLMAGAMIGEGTSYKDLTYTVALNEEDYGVGFRKGSDLVEALNQFFKDTYADGTMMKIAKKYGVQESVIEQK